MNYKVYVLTNKKGKIYIGQTFDLGKRLGEHNLSGDFNSRAEAIRREKYFKTGAGRDWLRNRAFNQRA